MKTSDIIINKIKLKTCLGSRKFCMCFQYSNFKKLYFYTHQFPICIIFFFSLQNIVFIRNLIDELSVLYNNVDD